jgi:hypothetical protein
MGFPVLGIVRKGCFVPCPARRIIVGKSVYLALQFSAG